MSKKKKRPVDIVIISDVHLGTYGCHAKELFKYLKSIKPNKVILNGDFIDIWQFSKRYWPKHHMQVIKHLTGMIAKGVKVYYVTGNHDEMLRKFAGFKMGAFKIVNKVVLPLNGKRAWIFHGDVFDVTMQHAKWLTRIGSVGYDFLIQLNHVVNYIYAKIGKGPISMSKKIKNSVKSAVKYINKFEETASEIAIESGYDYVICGHIHQPEIREFRNKNGQVTYLNSGDWVENLTALEYYNGEWIIYKYNEDTVAKSMWVGEDKKANLEAKELFQNLMREEFNIIKQ